jgi:hypothetical protein
MKEKKKIRKHVTPSDGQNTHLAPGNPIREAILSQGLFLSWVVVLKRPRRRRQEKTTTRELFRKHYV